VLAVKSVVYSLAPSIMNFVLPLAAKYIANDNLYNIKVYRVCYPIFAIFGIALTIIVYANTQEKIVQAKTHTIQISFIDAFKEVAKNKYFWIIALAGWLGFLESAYGNILSWSYTYGHTCSGDTMSLINLLTGNASFWGMLLAPICIRKFGKKKVLVGINFLNIVFILSMLINMRSIWWLFVCVYFNWLVGAFEQITTPAIQADIRDYQQYRTGERIDGMFATVSTIGNLVTLATSSVLPAVEKA
jgi:Na+/melibiose symporter-like transporter